MWCKSSRGNSNGSDCVEVADNLPGRILVRDSKDQTGPTFTFNPTAWRSFITGAATLR